MWSAIACSTTAGPGARCSGSASSWCAHAAQAGVLAVADGDDEVAAQEDHQLAGLDDLVGRRRRACAT